MKDTPMEDNQKLIQAINELNDRLKVVESADKSPREIRKEERQDIRREERREKNEAVQYLKKKGVRVTPGNVRRYEEIKHRYSQLRSPVQTVQKSRTKPEDSSKLTFYCWQDGKIGTIQISGGSFSQLED